MPIIKIDGEEVSLTNENCPIELVDSGTQNSGLFFKPNGIVDIAGVTENNKQPFVIPDNIPTELSICNDDAFNGALKVNGIVQRYFKQGLAPLGNTIYTMNSGIYVTPKDKHIFTFIALSGTGGGGAGGYLFTKGGVGGNTPPAIIFTIYTDNQLTIGFSGGRGGTGGYRFNANGGNGGDGGYSSLFINGVNIPFTNNTSNLESLDIQLLKFTFIPLISGENNDGLHGGRGGSYNITTSLNIFSQQKFIYSSGGSGGFEMLEGNNGEDGKLIILY